MASVRLIELTKRYAGSETLAVNHINLDIDDGEFVCLVGPSGCGKTTALRMIAGLEEITSGQVEIGSRVVNDLPPRERDIALVFQSYALYPHMTVYDNMSFGLRLRKVPKDQIDKSVKEAARILDLEPFLGRKPGQLSGGQRQRVALGRAIVREPAAFLMDEPLSNLDAKLRVQTRAEIARLHHRLGATMIYVTHDQVEAMTMADRIAVINGGVLEQVGSPQELYDNPQNRFVAGFIGSPAMNFVPVRVETGEAGIRLVGAEPEMGVEATPDALNAAALRRLSLSTVDLGVRPEHLQITPSEGGGLRVTTKVDVIEFLGNDAHVHLTAGPIELVATVGAREPLKVGDQVTLWAPSSRLYLFHPDTGAAIASERSETAPDRAAAESPLPPGR